MTFLTPIPALLAAAVTIPALLVLYLLKLRRRPIRVSSTLLWLQATRDLQVNVPFRWLRPTWLLFLQGLILALFLLAMARPTIRAAGATAARTILLLDRSASMSALEGPSTRLSTAKARARDLLAGLSRSGSSPVSVITFAAQPAIITNFSADRQATAQAIDAIAPSDQPGDLAAALRLCSAMLAGDTDESGRRSPALVVLLSDGGFPQGQSLTLAGAEFRFERIGSIGDQGRDNLGITAFSARRDRDDPGVVRIFARIQNASRRELATGLSLSLDGAIVDRRPLIIPAAGSEPSESAASFQIRSRDGGIAQLSIDRADALAADNSAAIVLSPAAKPRLILIVPDRAPGVPSTSWVITTILDELQFPYRTMSGSAFEADAASGAIGRPDLVIIDGAPVEAPPQTPTLAFGVPLPGAAPGTTPPSAGYFIFWRRTHPVLRDLSLDSVYVSRARPFPASLPSGTLTELARGADGPWIVEAAAAVPRISVAFDPADSTWPLSASFPVFLASAIDYLTLRGDESAGRAFTTAQPAQLQAPGPLSLNGPATLTASTTTGLASFGLVERAGVYRDPAHPSVALAVNLLDPLESSLTVRDSIQVSGDVVIAQGAGLAPRELWPWAIVAALVLLAIEWFLNAALMRT